MRVVTFAEYPHLECAQLDWIIPDVVPKPGNITILGSPKAGKSYLSVQLALAVAKGEPFLGYPTNQHRVLYLQFDTSMAVWKKMLTDLDKKGIDLEGQVYIPHPEDLPRPFDITKPDMKDKLRKILELSEPDLVIIDVLRELHHYDENDSTGMKLVSDHVDSVFKDYAVIQLHHTRKLPDDYAGKNVVNTARGSSYIAGKSDAFWLLHSNTLYMVPRFAMPVTLELKRLDSGFFESHTVPRIEVQEPTISLNQQLKDLCLKHPGYLKNQIYEIEEHAIKALGVSKATFFRRLAGWDPIASAISSSPLHTIDEPPVLSPSVLPQCPDTPTCQSLYAEQLIAAWGSVDA